MNEPAAIELGLDTFGDVTRDESGALAQRRRRPSATSSTQAVLADEVGLSFFGVGEHHRPEFAVSSPEIVLAAAAARTEQHPPRHRRHRALERRPGARVRAVRDARRRLVGGRAEVILGRGSFIESFPLFGFDLRDYEVLFEEKLELFSRLLDEKPVTWQGTTRAAARRGGRVPQDRERAQGMGGSRRHARVRRARRAPRLRAHARDHRRARRTASARSSTSTTARSSRSSATRLPVGVHSPGHVADTDQQAWDEAYAGFEAMNNTIGRERGWPPYSRMRFQRDVGPEGALYVGLARDRRAQDRRHRRARSASSGST